MLFVYGADWCDDTKRSRRLLRRLGVPHQYFNIDEDLDALHRAMALTGGQRRTPVIDLGGPVAPQVALVEPDNAGLVAALVERRIVTDAAVRERLMAHNVGDVERILRAVSGAGLVLATRSVTGRARWPIRVAGGLLAVSGLAGWCPAYSLAAVHSLDGPGDRPAEAHRKTWLTRSHEAAR